MTRQRSLSPIPTAPYRGSFIVVLPTPLTEQNEKKAAKAEKYPLPGCEILGICYFKDGYIKLSSFIKKGLRT
ncbi:MAG: hypothetical protein C0622_12085 [Desulfuromonas sp.]|nr:MAG: hypothetical protein C0622_12085 [Desulfuromonas sp.]